MKKADSYIVDFAAIALGDQERAREGWRRGGRAGAAARWKKDRARRKDARALIRAERGKVWLAKHPKRWPIPGWQVLTCRMVEGEWYGLSDIRALMPESPRNSVKVWFYMRAKKAGVYERALNADFDGSRHAGSQSEPRYLYRLSVEGVARVAEWRLELLAGQGSGKEV